MGDVKIHKTAVLLDSAKELITIIDAVPFLVFFSSIVNPPFLGHFI